MLKLSLQSLETFNEETNEFEAIGGLDVELEHSLYTVAKWESTYKTYFSKGSQDPTFILKYIKCMCMTENVPDSAWATLTQHQIATVLDYMQDPQTATKISNLGPQKKQSRITSAELIYSWMFALHIPLECEHWHFNRLMTLIEVCSIESCPKKKMPKKTAMQRQRELNAMRRAQYNTTG